MVDTERVDMMTQTGHSRYMNEWSEALRYWIDVAVLGAGHRVVQSDHRRDSVVIEAWPDRKVNNTAWGVGAIIILLAAFVTFGLSLLLFVPYLIVWAVVAVRGGPKRRLYVLTVDRDGAPVTEPSNMVWTLWAGQRNIESLRDR